MKAFDSAAGDPTESVQKALETEYKFAYRSGIGEIIYAMVTCRPDVSTQWYDASSTALARPNSIITLFIIFSSTCT